MKDFKNRKMLLSISRVYGAEKYIRVSIKDDESYAFIEVWSQNMV